MSKRRADERGAVAMQRARESRALEGHSNLEDTLLALMRAGVVFPMTGLSVVETNSLKRLEKRGLCRFAGGVYGVSTLKAVA